MSKLRPKVAPIRLDPISYERLRQQVLRRDGWRCQSCDTMSGLEVHNQQFRSQSGVDTERNLITLYVAIEPSSDDDEPDAAIQLAL